MRRPPITNRPPISHMTLNEDELADEIDAILGYRAMLGDAVLQGQNPADWPALKFWGKFDEGTGTAIVDYSDADGNGSPGTTNLAVTTGGTGNAWGTADAMATVMDATNFAYAQTSGAANADLRTVGTKAILLESWVNITGGSSNNILGVGRHESSTNHGYGWYWNDSGNGQLQFRIGGPSGGDRTASFTSTPADLRGNLRHVLTVYRGGGDTDVDLYIEGVLVQTAALSGDPGSLAVTSNSSLGRLYFGVRPGSVPSGFAFCPAVFHNSRIWVLNGAVPSTIAAIAQQMASSPVRLPSGLKGVA